MPHRREQARASLPTEITIDLVTTTVLTLLFHYLFGMPWGLALLIAGPSSLLGWWCLLHLEHDGTAGGPDGSWISTLTTSQL